MVRERGRGVHYSRVIVYPSKRISLVFAIAPLPYCPFPSSSFRIWTAASCSSLRT